MGSQRLRSRAGTPGEAASGGFSPWILASSSPRRQELLSAWGVRFEVDPPDVQEWQPASGDPRAVSTVNASRKVESVKTRHPGRWVMAADTVVAVQRPREVGYDILGQPADRVDARRMLEALSGRTHLVCTAMVATGGRRGKIERVSVARVTFNALTPAAIDEFLCSGEWRGKAGGYGIQGEASHFVAGLEGELETVIGLSRRDVLEVLGMRAEEESRRS